MSDVTQKILDLRAKVLRGDRITLEEAREAVALLREYTSASHAKTTKERKKKGLANPDFDLDALFKKE